MAYSRKTISNVGDRVQIEQSEARMLFRTWETTQQRVLTKVRMEWIEKTYGIGAVGRIRGYMDKMRNGELE
jgi:hypothetical protein